MWLVVSKFGVACFLHACLTTLLPLLARSAPVFHDAAAALTVGFAEMPFSIMRGHSPPLRRKLD